MPRALPSEPKPAKGPRLVSCKNRACRKRFMPEMPWIRFCCDDCGVTIGMEAIAKQRSKRERADRATDRARKQAVKTKGDHIAEAQIAFNRFIRLRDQLAGHACISSGLPLDWSGNNVDAGHYRSRGSAPHLRFDERNVHTQSKRENRYASGNATDYRIGLIARIGLAAVEALEFDQASRDYTIDDLKVLKAHYVAKTKLLKEAANA